MSEEGASPNKEVGYRSLFSIATNCHFGLTDLSWPSIFVVLYVISLFYLQKVDSNS